ncbi:MAG TPA: UpxY family transcription antiterminator [Dissulfurispiraceae bacterium]|nr:UpxY family transcription antiterminator [Dissulfurispiraceae bacterium]
MDDRTLYNLSGKHHWFAVHVRSRHEFSVTERLLKFGIDTFLPVVDKLRLWKDRKKLVAFPLFPGYLFVHIGNSGSEKLAVLKTPGVVRFIGNTPGEPEPVPDDQVQSLQKLVESKETLDPYPYLKEGQRVRIKSGPLAGVAGILVERKGLHHLVLSVDILRQGVSVQIEASIAEAL